MKIVLPKNVEYIISTLEDAGFEAYAVGGCVRDSLLGRVPGDWDITTSALPRDVKRLFRRTIDTGIQHGTVTVIFKNGGQGGSAYDSYEVTTYRKDGEYKDGRHPESVTFVPSLEEDLARRDFTINAMAYSTAAGLVDIFGGREDLDGRTVRCVGDPLTRFSEDALRMMRAVRFAAQLGFGIETKTREAVMALAPSLEYVSAERVQVELVKTLLSDNPGEIKEMYSLGLTKVFLPEFDVMMETPQNNPHHDASVGIHTIRVLNGVPPTRILRLSALFHDFGKPSCLTTDESGIMHFKGHPEVSAQMARKVLRRLKFDNDTIARVVQLVRWHDLNPELTPKSVRRAIRKVGAEQYPDMFALKRADISGQSSYKRDEKLSYIDGYEKLWREIIKEKDCLSLSDLAVGGRDLIDAGIAPGPEMGEILSRMLDDVVDFPEHNSKDYLMREFVPLGTGENAKNP